MVQRPQHIFQIVPLVDVISEMALNPSHIFQMVPLGEGISEIVHNLEHICLNGTTNSQINKTISMPTQVDKQLIVLLRPHF